MVPDFLFPHKCSIQVQAVTQGAGAGGIKSWGDGTTAGNFVSQNVPCRLVPANPVEEGSLMQEGERCDYRVHFKTNPNVDSRNRIVFTDLAGNTRYLRVQETKNPDELGWWYKVFCLEERTADFIPNTV